MTETGRGAAAAAGAVGTEEEDRSASLVDTSSHQRKAAGHPLVLMSSTLARRAASRLLFPARTRIDETAKTRVCPSAFDVYICALACRAPDADCTLIFN